MDHEVFLALNSHEERIKKVEQDMTDLVEELKAKLKGIKEEEHHGPIETYEDETETEEEEPEEEVEETKPKVKGKTMKKNRLE